MLEVFIVDDEKRALDTFSKVLTTFFDNVKVVGMASDVEEAYEGILEQRPQLVFLDIETGRESGFQLLERFGNINFHVVFVTAHEEYALKAIKFSALDYIIKPAGVADLKKVILKVEESPIESEGNDMVKQMFGNLMNKDSNEHKITMPVTDGYEFVKVGDILYLRADGSYTHLKLKDQSTLTSSKNLKYYTHLLKDYGFYRIHNSTLINTQYIRKLSKAAGGSVIMEDQVEFSISKSRKDEFMSILSLK